MCYLLIYLESLVCLIASVSEWGLRNDCERLFSEESNEFLVQWYHMALGNDAL